MKNMTMCLFIIISVLFTVQVQGITLNKKIVTPDANWLIHVDTQELKKTGLYEYIMSSNFKLDIEKTEKKFLKNVGLNLRTDVKGFTVFGNGSLKDDIVVNITGNFNEKKLVKHLKKEGAEFTTARYKGYKIYKMKKAGYAVFDKKAGFFFVRNEKRLHAVLARVNGRDISDSDLIKKAEAIPSHAFFMAIANDVSRLAGMHSKAVMLQKAEAATFIAAEKGRNFSVNLALLTKSEETATQLEQILKGLIAFGSMQNEHIREFEDVLKSLNVSKQGRTLSVNLSMSSDRMIEIFKDKISKKKCCSKK